MDAERARELLAAERRRVEELLADAQPRGRGEELSLTDNADAATDTYDAELDEGLADDLREQLEAVDARGAARRRRHVRPVGRER